MELKRTVAIKFRNEIKHLFQDLNRNKNQELINVLHTFLKYTKNRVKIAMFLGLDICLQKSALNLLGDFSQRNSKKDHFIYGT